MRRNKTSSDQFIAVFDTRKHRIRGLWKRGSKYYVQLRVGGKPKRISLQAGNLTDAQAELEAVRTANREGKLPARRRTPPYVRSFRGEYLYSPIFARKKPSTRKGERIVLENWKRHLGDVRIDKITETMVKSYRERRLSQGVTART